MCEDDVIIENITYFDDVLNMIQILKHLGVSVKEEKSRLIINSSAINNFYIPEELSNKLRASIFFLGPLISKFKKARVAYPGGCSIGARPIDIHIAGLKKLGGKVIDKHGIIFVDGLVLKSNTITLSFPSVGATENLIMASVFVKGNTTIIGGAKEPEVVDLCNFLNLSGAKIKGAGTDFIHIEGVEKLKGIAYTPIPDRIIAGTYILAPLATGGMVEVENVKVEHIKPILELVSNNGCKIIKGSDKIIIEAFGRPNGFGKIETMPYPFFPTDLAQPMSAIASLANGNTILTENLFEGRFKHIPELVKMGANIIVKDRTAFIEGIENLYGASVVATDLRGGASLVLAALGAEGYTTISNASIINRGYYNLHKKLNNIGASITTL